ncbi:FAD-binding protein [Spongisporangium articulatum]|uniref:FAD-binding protein n=1 Tax=Spongisporangium articulatum TaxID=3362603 RepID=A0ABW8AN54_9ACTN
MTAVSRRNWAGNITWHAERFAAPESVAELQALVAGAERVKAVGSGHSFSDIADTAGLLVSTAALPRDVERLGPHRVRVAAGVRYGELALELDRYGLASANLASLPHISVAGTVATGTHGSGVGNRSLATHVAALDLVTSTGELVTLRRGEDDFAGAVVGLGALGVVTAVELDVVPAFEVAVSVHEWLPFDVLLEHYEAVLAAAYSVSVFLDWSRPLRGQVWLKHRVDDGAPGVVDEPWFAAAEAGPRNPVPGISAENAVQQGGVPGPSFQRLPHFRLEMVPSNGEELQSEYFVAAADGPAALAALAPLADLIHPVLQVCELRRIAADDLWLSPSGGRDSAAFHFTWVPDLAAVLPVLERIEAALAPFDARPHWGKVFPMTADRLVEVYPRVPEFLSLAGRLDPRGAFANAWTGRHLGR